MRYLYIIFLSLLSFFFGLHAFAQCESGECDLNKTKLRPYEPTYILHNSGMKDDENSWRVHYSFLYDVVPRDTKDENPIFHGSYLFASYTGEFDFYWTTRKSSPVINRINNPALHWRFFNEGNNWVEKWIPDWTGVRWVDIAFEHKSNGQTVDTQSPRDREQIQLAYDTNDYHFFDTISRTENFISAETHFVSADKKTRLFIKGKLFASYESDVVWGRDANRGLDLGDYDRYRIVMQHNLPRGEWSLEWVFGDKFLKADSIDLDYVYSKKHPFFVKFHYGPLYTLSNYSKSESVIGFGYKFIPDF